jgi:cation transport protein ChaC
MSLTREDLENGLPRRLWSECGHEPRALTDAELEASIGCVLSGSCAGQDVWIFAYGSLMWNPLFHYIERRPATLRGFHRSFCLWSIIGRGTLECPGLVLGLDSGGQCCGLAYRLSAVNARDELKLLWQREMVVGSYFPRWVRVDAQPCAQSAGCTEELRALAFVINRDHPNYAGKLPIETIVNALASARGRIGSAAEYLFSTVDTLSAHDLRDPHLEALRDQVAQRCKATGT